jgi:hypothetical protein
VEEKPGAKAPFLATTFRRAKPLRLIPKAQAKAKAKAKLTQMQVPQQRQTKAKAKEGGGSSPRSE